MRKKMGIQRISKESSRGNFLIFQANATDRLKMTKSHILDLIKEILFNKTEIRVLPSSLVDIINMEACRGI